MRRWFGIRHVRWLWLACYLARRSYHSGHWYCADPTYLDQVWKGEA